MEVRDDRLKKPLSLLILGGIFFCANSTPTFANHPQMIWDAEQFNFSQELQSAYQTCEATHCGLDHWQNFYLKLKTPLYQTLRMGKEDNLPRFASSQDVIELYLNIEAVLTKLEKELNWIGLDGKGSPPISVVNAEGTPGESVYLPELKTFVFINGDQSRVKNAALSFDLVARGFGHAMISATSKLVGVGESGAIIESFSDFLAKALEGRGSWRVGDQHFYQPGKALRNLERPSEFGDPEAATDILGKTEQCSSKNDFCYVHKNSTIVSRAMVHFAKEVGVTRALKIYTKAVTEFLNPESDFQGLGRGLYESCRVIEGSYWHPVCHSLRESLSFVSIWIPDKTSDEIPPPDPGNSDKGKN